MKLSIIIPVYNVEQWVGRCLESCLNQDIPKDDYEILCIDDGSTDNSCVVVEEYVKKYSNIILLHQENAGQSAARNNAMSVANGRFVWFVDSDDWIQENCIGRLIQLLEKDNLDTLCFSFQFAEENGTVHHGGYSQYDSDIVMNGRDFIVKVPMPAGPWAAIHKRSFLEQEDIKYIEGIKREDEDFTVRAYCSANRIEFVNIVAYNYFQRTGSTMKSAKTSKSSYDLLTVADSLHNFCKSKLTKDSEAYNAVMNKVSFAFSQALAYCVDGNPLISEYSQRPYYPLSINSQLSNSLKWKYRLINLSLKLYLLIYKLKK